MCKLMSVERTIISCLEPNVNEAVLPGHGMDNGAFSGAPLKYGEPGLYFRPRSQACAGRMTR